MLYFAYGSNMSVKRLRARVPSAQFRAVAELLRHELKFHKIGQDGSAKCDAAETGEPGHVVLGVVFELNRSEKSVLDLKEGLGRGYEEKVVVVSGEGEIMEAVMYYATRIDPLLKPFHWYKEHVLRGAGENGLPEQYVQMIVGVESVVDFDFGRHEEEMEIYK